MYLSKEDLVSLERFRRINIINSVSGVKSANLIGTISNSGISNVAVFSSVFHAGSSPALLGFILRPVEGFRRDTYENIKANGYFTINHIHQEFVDKAHATSSKFKSDESEFKHCKLTNIFLNNFLAPFVLESKIKIGLNLIETIKIKSNNCLILIGEIEHLFIEDEIIKKSGHINLDQINTLGVNGLDTYYKLKKIIQFPHVKSS
jgi:flavin reductase (DIM6/NTAB) family NADH-FMN oxidoreductase RutF